MADGFKGAKEAILAVPRSMYRAAVFETFTRIIERTPVDIGRAAQNWQITAGQPATGVLDGADPDKSGAQAKLLEYLNNLDVTEKTWIVNNLPYIHVLEFGLYPNPPAHPTGKTAGGFSIQAPQGMVGITHVEMEQIINQWIADERAK